jgi:Sigma-70, region 4
VTALQVLPPRQVAVLVLRDVLGFHTNEVADMLDSTVDSVDSALKRARASLQRRMPPTGDREPPTASDSTAEDVIVARFVRAWEAADLDALVALPTDDVFVSMPPMPLRIRGPGPGGPLLRQPVRRRPAVRRRADTSQRTAGIRGLPARPHRHPPRDRPVRPHPHRRPDLRHDPLRQQRAPIVRATTNPPESGLHVVEVSIVMGDTFERVRDQSAAYMDRTRTVVP